MKAESIPSITTVKAIKGFYLIRTWLILLYTPVWTMLTKVFQGQIVEFNHFNTVKPHFTCVCATITTIPNVRVKLSWFELVFHELNIFPVITCALISFDVSKNFQWKISTFILEPTFIYPTRHSVIVFALTLIVCYTLNHLQNYL